MSKIKFSIKKVFVSLIALVLVGAVIFIALDKNIQNQIKNFFDKSTNNKEQVAGASTFWEERIKQLETELDLKNSELVAENERFFNLETQYTELILTKNRLEKELEEEGAVKDLIQSKLDIANSRIENLTTQLAEKETTITALKNQILELESTIKELEEKLLYFAPLALNCYSWLGINEISKSGRASDYFKVGDEIDVEFGNETITLVILGFNHDELSNGLGKAGITFGLKYQINDNFAMSGSDNSWKNSTMRNSTLPAILAKLPKDLQSVIKNVNKQTTIGNQSQMLETTSEKLFLFSIFEISGNLEDYPVMEGKQYEYWKTVKNGQKISDRVITKSEGATQEDFGYWLRTATSNYSGRFQMVSGSGYFQSNNCGNERGIVFGFCV